MILAIVTTLVNPSEADYVGDTVRMTLTVGYYGAGVLALQGRNVDYSIVSVTLDPTDTPRQIRDEFVDAIVAEGAAIGYTVRRRDVVVPALLRGQ